MKRLIVGTLCSLLMMGGAAKAQETETVINPYVVGNPPNYHQIKPFNLAYLAYRGYLKDQGIPSYLTLLQEYRSGKITASDIVKSAIRAGRLSKSVLNDQGYVDAVDNQLDTLARD
jgi:hypothetical protein